MSRYYPLNIGAVTRIILLALLVSALFQVPGATAQGFFTLPQTNSLEALQFSAATEVYDLNGELIGKLFAENRTVVSINNVSPYLLDAVVANEDARFYSHYGIDPIGILRAVWVDVRTGAFTEGGSTITQQLAKNMFLTQERTLWRKLKEAMLAIIIESKFSKQEILQAYLNQVYFGEGAYGAEAAAQVYFGKHAVQLDLAESALLAGLPRGPGLYSPFADINAAQKRRSTVLDGMVKAGYITRNEAQAADARPIDLAGRKQRVVQASYFLDYVAQELVARYGADRVYKGGLKVYTSLNIAWQKAAETALGEYQGGVLVLNCKTGYINAMVGGRNYQESQINRALTEIRQPGSVFKPFVYAEALNQGMAANTVLVDEPVDIGGYRPQNYDKRYRGAITLKKALRESVNVAAVKLGQQVGMQNVLNLAQNMGITTIDPGDDNLASALGGLTRGVTLLEVCAAFTAFSNNGVLSKPFAILRVADDAGLTLEEARPEQRQVMRPEIAYIMTDMLKSVVESGTGTPAAIGRPAAGKTGTTDNYETAWFIGYTPDVLAGIVVGNDDRTPVGISGTQVAGLWGKMMEQIVTGTAPADFTAPAGVVTAVPVCANSGRPADARCREIEYSAFIKGTEPRAERQNVWTKWRWPWFQLPGF